MVREVTTMITLNNTKQSRSTALATIGHVTGSVSGRDATSPKSWSTSFTSFTEDVPMLDSTSLVLGVTVALVEVRITFSF